MISTLLLATLLAATPPSDRCAADIGHAEAVAFEASRTQHECMDPRACLVARELVTAAQAQLAAVRQLCSVTEDAQVSPFASEADPFEPAPLMANVPDYDGEDAAFRAVMGE